MNGSTKKVRNNGKSKSLSTVWTLDLKFRKKQTVVRMQMDSELAESIELREEALDLLEEKRHEWIAEARRYAFNL